jgi:hypothetical protein
MMHDLVFLFDVDNTLLDNDRVEADLAAHLTEAYGVDGKLYWDIFEQLRRELGYADYLGAWERFRLEKMHDPRVLRMSSWLVDYPFGDRLYRGALHAVEHVQQWGPAVILSDGDAVFQPRKIERSGLWAAFDGRVLRGSRAQPADRAHCLSHSYRSFRHASYRSLAHTRLWCYARCDGTRCLREHARHGCGELGRRVFQPKD